MRAEKFCSQRSQKVSVPTVNSISINKLILPIHRVIFPFHIGHYCHLLKMIISLQRDVCPETEMKSDIGYI